MLTFAWSVVGELLAIIHAYGVGPAMQALQEGWGG